MGGGARRWTDPADRARFDGLRQEALQARASGRFVVLMGLCLGVVEMVDLKMAYWLRALAEKKGCVER